MGKSDTGGKFDSSTLLFVYLLTNPLTYCIPGMVHVNAVYCCLSCMQRQKNKSFVIVKTVSYFNILTVRLVT